MHFLDKNEQASVSRSRNISLILCGLRPEVSVTVSFDSMKDEYLYQDNTSNGLIVKPGRGVRYDH